MSQLRYLSTSQACEMLRISRSRLWGMAGGPKLSPPIQPTPRRAYWLADEIEKLKPAFDKEREVLDSLGV